MKSKDISTYMRSISDVSHFISETSDTDTSGNVDRMLKNLAEVHTALKAHRQKQLKKNYEKTKT